MADNQDDYLTAPVHAQYWTGSQGPIQQYPVPQGYYQQQQPFPQQYYGPAQAQGYYPQQQPFPQQYYGPTQSVSPPFHPQYWTGQYFPQAPKPYYTTQGFNSGIQYAPMYPKGRMPYPMHPLHPGVYGSPYPKRKTSGLTKTLIGAAVVGVVAGAVARGK